MIENPSIAATLADISRLLSHQHGDRFRIHAFAHAAEILDGFDPPVADIFARDGLTGVMAIPGIGGTIAHVIEDLLTHGESSLLTTLKAQSYRE